jgi:hypothetical protein
MKKMKPLNTLYNNFSVLIGFAIVLRLTIFILAMIFVINDHKGYVVSPLVEQQGIDTQFYQRAANHYKAIGLSVLIEKTKAFYQTPEIAVEKPRVAQNKISPLPLFPLTLIAFNYKSGNTLPLAIFFLLICCILCWGWLKWLKQNQVPNWGLWIFALIPNPVYFMLAVSTDLLFAFLFFLFFISYFSKNKYSKNGFWIYSLIGMSLLRPNAISIILFVLWDKFFNTEKALIRHNKTFNLSIILATGFLIVFTFPYFIYYLTFAKSFTYFGISNAEYLKGAFEVFPEVLNKVISIFSFVLAKIFYFVGLRPSYSGISYHMLFLRSFVGIFLLPGFFYLYIYGDKRIKYLFSLYIFPIFLGATQDRYHLPLMPILYFYGILAFKEFFNKLFSRRSNETQ